MRDLLVNKSVRLVCNEEEFHQQTMVKLASSSATSVSNLETRASTMEKPVYNWVTLVSSSGSSVSSSET
ncbi:hypothetical protein TKK_0010388 [Trichogramma kaykai]